MTLEVDLAAARLWASTQAPYLSSALFALAPRVRPGLGTFGVDRRWRLYVDPALLTGWSVDQVGSVLLHEVHHLIRDHAERAAQVGVGETEFHRWNVAADLEINDDLASLPLPGGCFPADFDLPAGEVAEHYFARLGGAGHLTGPECGSGAHGADMAWDDGMRSGDGADPGLSAVEGDLLRREVAVQIRALGPGGAPGGLRRWAEGLLQPRVNWRAELRAAVCSGVAWAAGAVDYSYGRPGRRTVAGARPAVLLPTLVRPVPRVVVVVDTSASMADEDLSTALAELHGILQEVSGVGPTRVLACDTAVGASQQVFTADAVDLQGGGGTDMGEGIAAACTGHPPPQVIVVLTDGITAWPDLAPTRARVVIGLIGDDGDGPPWAHSVRIPAAVSAGTTGG